MHVISRQPLRAFSKLHPPAKSPLDAWFSEVGRAGWKSFADVKATYRSADVVAGNRVIFNIGGNKYRLVVKIAWQCQTVFVLFVGTHAEYDRIDVKTISYQGASEK
jgi:mRNA interferase HigB